MKITITRALAELKLYDSRITKKLNESQFADCKTGRVSEQADIFDFEY